MSHQSDQLRAFFDASAPQYEAAIVPAFRQFAAAVVATAQPRGDECALDVGTGTGILARLLAEQVQQVVGIDFAPQMVEDAQRLALRTTHFVQADAHDLPFAPDTFDLVAASFGLNATHPRRIFPALYKVLKPGGVLAFHEWSVQHPLDSALTDTFAAFMLPDEDVSDALYQTRELMRSTRPWDNLLQDVEDFEAALSAAGFRAVQVWEDRPATCVLSYDAFLNYKMAWAGRQAELAAMDASLRGDCLDALRNLLQDAADSAGNIHYDPLLFRVRALK